MADPLDESGVVVLAVGNAKTGEVAAWLDQQVDCTEQERHSGHQLGLPKQGGLVGMFHHGSMTNEIGRGRLTARREELG